MFALLFSLLRLLFSGRNVREIALENLALRQQLAVMKRQCPRTRLRELLEGRCGADDPPGENIALGPAQMGLYSQQLEGQKVSSSKK
jgi:hypothetical protein